MELNITWTTRAMMSNGKQGSKLLLAAEHFVIRINISRGIRETKHVIARLQTRKESINSDRSLGKPTAVSFDRDFKNHQ